MSNSQFLQWISGPSRGQTEVIEQMMQDGQTSKDIIILSGGRNVEMTEVGKKFIILPSREFELSASDLNSMYPEQRSRDRMREGLRNVDQASSQKKQVPQKRQQVSSFSSDLLSRAKRENTKLSIELDMDLPTKSFFKMINDTFDENTVNEVLDLLIQAIDQEKIKSVIKEKIINSYGE